MLRLARAVASSRAVQGANARPENMPPIQLLRAPGGDFQLICMLSLLTLRRGAPSALPSRAKPKRRKLDLWGGIVGLVIQLIAGGVGGNIAGSALKQYDLGAVGNTIAGVIGGGVGAQIIGALLGGGAGATAAGTGGLDIGSIIGQIASGGVGGGILMVIVGLIKQAMGGQRA